MSCSRGVISYCLFGTETFYFDGALKNAALVNDVFPGWHLRVYLSDQVSSAVARALESAGAEVIVKQQTDRFDGLFWRFLPAADPALGHVAVRDVDSWLSARDRAAVAQWVDSGCDMHIIRDHPKHSKPVQAGLWGCRGGAVPDMAELIARYGAEHGFALPSCDEHFLARVIYPRLRGSLHVNSEFVYFDGETPEPIPHRREGSDYLGYPPGRGETAQRRRAVFERARHTGLRERPWKPDWGPAPT